MNSTWPDGILAVETLSPYKICQPAPTDSLVAPVPTGLLIYSWAIVITAALGVIGNVLSGIVLYMPDMRSSYSLLLMALTATDTLQLVQHLIFLGAPALQNLGLQINVTADCPELARVLTMVGLVAFTASPYITVLVSFERYMAVCKPFQSLWLFPTKRTTLIYVTAILVGSTVFNLPKWWETEPCQVILNLDDLIMEAERSVTSVNGTASRGWGMVARLGPKRMQLTDMRRDALYTSLYVNWANFVVNLLLPFVTLLVVNMLIYRGMTAANERQRMIAPAGQGADNSITCMLIVVVAVFCFCQVWYPVARAADLWFKRYKRALSRLSTYMYCFNASVNFLIYCVWGRKFRRQLRELFWTCVHCGAGGGLLGDSKLELTRTSQGGSQTLTKTMTVTTHV